MPASPHVLFAGGGSASHLFPGMAVAEHLRRRMPNMQITFAGSGAARERHTVRIAGHHYTTIPAHAMPRNPLRGGAVCHRQRRRLLRRPLDAARAARVAGRRTGRFDERCGRPRRRCPRHSGGADGAKRRARRTTRWLSRAAAMVCAAFEEVRPHLHVQAPVTVTGNPSRAAFEDLYHGLYGRTASQRAGASPTPATRALKHRRRTAANAGWSSSAAQAAPVRSTKRFPRPQETRRPDERLAGRPPDRRFATPRNRSPLRPARPEGPRGDAHRRDRLGALRQRSGGLPLRRIDARRTGPGRRAGRARPLSRRRPTTIKWPTPRSSPRPAPAGWSTRRSRWASLDAALARELDPLIADHHLRGEMARAMQRLARPQAASQIAAAITDQLCGGVSGLMAA